MIELDQSIRALRGGKDELAPPARLEVEIFPDGRPREIATVFLRNGECPLACVYCALYRQTTGRPATGKEIAAQIRGVRARRPDVPGLKLYNASSLFEPHSIVQSRESLRDIAAELGGLDLVVVEARSENARGAVHFSRLLESRLEVAIGFETADDGLLRLLNKPTRLARFREAAGLLADQGLLLRAFVLVGPPFVPQVEARPMARDAFEEARRAGARVVSLLPVVSEHEPMEVLRRAGFFSEVSLDEYFETVCDCAALRSTANSATVLLSEAESLRRLPGCPNCAREKRQRLAALNSTGEIRGFDCNDHRPCAAVPVRRPTLSELTKVLRR